MKFTDAELVRAFEGVDGLRNSFPVNNPRASTADMKRHLLREPEHFVCYGGYKSFYMDWNFDILALRRMAGAHVLGMGVCEYAAGARRLHGLHRRLLPRFQRDASFCRVARGCNRLPGQRTDRFRA